MGIPLCPEGEKPGNWGTNNLIGVTTGTETMKGEGGLCKLLMMDTYKAIINIIGIPQFPPVGHHSPRSRKPCFTNASLGIETQIPSCVPAASQLRPSCAPAAGTNGFSVTPFGILQCLPNVLEFL